MGRSRKERWRTKRQSKQQAAKEEEQRLRELAEKLEGETQYLALANPMITIAGAAVFGYTVLAVNSVEFTSQSVQVVFFILIGLALTKPALTEMLHSHTPIRSEKDVRAYKLSFRLRTLVSTCWLAVCSYPFFSSAEAQAAVSHLTVDLGLLLGETTSQSIADVSAFVASGIGGWIGVVLLGIIANFFSGWSRRNRT